MSGIATLWKPVVNVTDLDEGERFWSTVSGLSPMGRHGGQYSVLDSTEPTDRGAWILCNSSPTDTTVLTVARTSTSGSTTWPMPSVGSKKSAALCQRPPELYQPDGIDMLEWAVMQDPFGNQFCLIRWPLP
jgi:hypothetical protein